VTVIVLGYYHTSEVAIGVSLVVRVIVTVDVAPISGFHPSI